MIIEKIVQVIALPFFAQITQFDDNFSVLYIIIYEIISNFVVLDDIILRVLC